jgi:hypothetical protein
MFWMLAYPLLGEVGGGLALEFLSFLGPKWHTPIFSMPFQRAQKTLEFQGPAPYLLALVMDMHAFKTLCTGPINQRCINIYIFLAFLLNFSTTNFQ